MSDARRAPVAMTTDAVGGVWQYTLTCAAHLSRSSGPLLLVGTGPQPNRSQRAEAEALGIPVFWLDAPLDWMLDEDLAIERSAAAVRRFVETRRPTLLHLNSPVLAAFMPDNLPLVAAAHSCLATWWRAMRPDRLPEAWHRHRDLTKDGFRRADAVLAPSAAFADALVETYGPLPNIRVVHNAATPVAPATKGAFVLAAGRLWDEAKNFAVLDAAVENLQWPVYVAGSSRGPRDAVCTLRNLRALGSLPHDELASWQARAPIFASTSRYEPFGLSVLEAASAGAALVLADIPTFRELWNGCALFVDPLSPESVRAALTSLIENDDARMRLAAAARARASDFSPERQADALVTIYSDVTHAWSAAV